MHVWFFGHQVIWKNKISFFVLRSICNKNMFKSNQYAQHLNWEWRVLLFYLFWKWDALSQFTFAHKWPLTDQRPRRVSMHRANFRIPFTAYVAVFDNVNSEQWRLTTKYLHFIRNARLKSIRSRPECRNFQRGVRSIRQGVWGRSRLPEALGYLLQNPAI